MKTSELLDGAAGVIEHNGWVQDDYWEAVPLDGGKWKNPRDCKVCPRGAIAVAAGRTPAWKVTNAKLPAEMDDADRADWDAVDAAEKALARHISDVIGIRARAENAIEWWADDAGRTLPQILGGLRAAAQAEREAGR